jgi:hypothetical protein
MKNKINYAVASLLAFSFVIAFSASSASADTDSANEIHAAGSTIEVHINDDGKVLVRGARVTAISASGLTANVSWGSSTIAWTVNTNSSTELIRRFGAMSSISEVQVGDYVSFQGPLDTTVAAPTVTAKALKDWSIQRKNASFGGTITSINSTNKSFVLATPERGNITVNTVASTTITQGSTTVPFTSLTVGKAVKEVKGLLNNLTMVLVADMIKLAK